MEERDEAALAALPAVLAYILLSLITTCAGTCRAHQCQSNSTLTPFGREKGKLIER